MYYRDLCEKRGNCLNIKNCPWRTDNWITKENLDKSYCLKRIEVFSIFQLLDNLCAPIWIVEIDGIISKRSEGILAKRVKVLQWVEHWNEYTSRKFAIDCAERVLFMYEERYPKDSRPRNAIEAAKVWISGGIYIKKLHRIGIAAENAANHTAGDVIWCGARSAAISAASCAHYNSSYYAAYYSSHYARESFWWYTKGAEESKKARAAEREWQANRLAYYLEPGNTILK
jgi:hypothetical protein